MTGILDLDGQCAIVEQDDGDLAIYATSDVEQKSDGTWGIVDGATPTGTLELEALLAGQVGTESDPVGEHHAEMSSVGELSVSDGDTVTSGPVGSSGDLVQMAAYPFDGKGYTASSTTFTKVATAVTEHRVIDYESIQNLPNIADVHYAWAGRVNANSGVDVTIRVSGSANTEATFTGSTFSPEVGPTAPVSAADSPRIPKLEVKTSDGSQGGVYGPSIILYGGKA